MPINTNRWNRIRYTFWAPIYNLIVRGFDPLRRKSIAQLHLQPGDRVLLIGAGTGADLPYIPAGVNVLATDLTAAMLARARRHARPGIEFRVMDGQALDLPDGSFDAVILHLIVAVIPDPVRCVREAARVLKPGGRAVILDKFLPDQASPSLLRRLANVAGNLLFSDLNRKLGEILEQAGNPLRLVRREPAAFGGFFQMALLRKDQAGWRRQRRIGRIEWCAAAFRPRGGTVKEGADPVDKPVTQTAAAPATPVPASGGRGPLQAGELVLFIDHKGRKHLIRLEPGGQWHTKWGIMPHDQIIGSEDGSRHMLPKGKPVVCWRPTLEDYVVEMPRKTQIIYPKDLGQIIVRGNIFPGARVMQTGLGSGSLACALLRFLGPTGELISYEYREEFARMAERNLAHFFGHHPPNHRIEIRDSYAGIDEQDLDTLILDLPEPERLVAAAAGALKLGGILLAWLPTTIQVHKLGAALRAEPQFDQIDVVELLLRPWHVTEESCRPAHRMVAHTGFLVSARRCPPRTLDGEQNELEFIPIEDDDDDLDPDEAEL